MMGYVKTKTIELGSKVDQIDLLDEVKSDVLAAAQAITAFIHMADDCAAIDGGQLALVGDDLYLAADALDQMVAALNGEMKPTA